MRNKILSNFLVFFDQFYSGNFLKISQFYPLSLLRFESKYWPFNLKYYSKEKEKEVLEKLNYPPNKYHTITRHNHEETFKKINTKLNEVELTLKNLNYI